MNGNVLTVVGNLTRDPELRFLSNGQALATFTVADNHGHKDRDGEWQSKVSFIDCKLWGAIAENVSESLSKGDRVIVHGRIDMNQWETPEGDKRSKLELDVDSIGPDLRFATSTTKKVESGDSRPKSSSNSGSKRGTRRQAEPDYDDSEEPF